MIFCKFDNRCEQVTEKRSPTMDGKAVAQTERSAMEVIIKAAMQPLLEEIAKLISEVNVLKESNRDLVRLLTKGNNINHRNSFK